MSYASGMPNAMMTQHDNYPNTTSGAFVNIDNIMYNTIKCEYVLAA